MIRAFPLAFAMAGAVAALVAIPFLFAGGPLDPTLDAQVFRWELGVPVNFSIDQGPLGERSNADAAQIVRDSFAKWEAVPTSTIHFLDRGFLPQDVTVSDYQAFLGSLTDEERANPVIFDTDGKIIDDRLGVGASENVLGFAGIRRVQLATRQYLSGWAVLNGKQAFASTFEQVVIHEIGHLIGLDHTQANHALAGTPRSNLVPLMYPIVQLRGPKEPLRDDIAWISWLYPESNFRATTGTITGKILRRSGTAFQGANVVAVQVDTSTPDLIESRSEVVSVVSDFLLQNTGDYEIPGLTPGNYVVFIEPIDREFTEGSGVGPFEGRFTNFVKDYWNGANESATDSDKPEEKTVIQVTAGEIVKDIILSSNEKVNDLDALSDDDEMLFEFPQGFNFPFFGKVYKEVVVNSDGNMTFGGGDSRPGQARDEERFLKGFPRIAPLFTDLDPGEPGDDKKVTATSSTTEVTFTWDNVPEFTDEGARPGNKFSVTLFSNGDIRFKFDDIQITPDSDNLQALVGITPGGSVPGSKIDLSAQSSPILFNTAPIYEVFVLSTFDLNGKEILFKADTSFQVSPVDLFFPFFQGNAQNFTGFAVTNFSSANAQLQMESRGANGSLLPFPDNPHTETIGSNQQVARLGHEFFKADAATIQNGWVRMKSNNSEVASFFQFGNGVTGPLTKLDGSVAFKEQSKVLFFSRVHHGSAAFRGLKNARTTLSIANPNDQSIILTLKLFQPTGVQIGGDITRPLAAGGMLFETLTSIFNLPSPVSDGFVRVDVTTGPGAVGFELIEIDTVSTGAFASDTVIGLNASFGNTATVLNSAQLASGNFGGISIFTNLKLVNTSVDPRAITLRAVREDGTEISVFGPFPLNGNQAFQRDVNEIFGFGPNTGAQIAGSIIVQATGPGVIGDIVFGDPVKVEFAAALPLQTQGARKAVFSQVALSPTIFTGLAVFNSGSSSAQVTIEVFSPEGTVLGSATLTVGAGQRFSKTLPELMTALAGKQVSGGFLIVRSTQPLIAQQLFGLLADGTIKLLSAVPPTVVE